MGAPVAQPFEQMLEITSGWVNNYSLEKTLKLDSTLLEGDTDVPPGRCAYIGPNGTWLLGPTGVKMPHFLWHGKNEPDVYNNGASPVTGTRHWIGVSPEGHMRGLPVVGGYEFQTTEFDDEASYPPNTLLMSDTDGKVKPVTGTDVLGVGITSWHENEETGYTKTSARGTNAHGVDVVTFYGVYVPVRS